MFLITQFLNNPNITEQGRLHQLARVHIQTEAAQAVDSGRARRFHQIHNQKQGTQTNITEHNHEQKELRFNMEVQTGTK